ncbi:MAG: Na+/H+ antiporter subunit E [Acidimicrobiales bacterium]|nr:Na+/H+ antiporter subunit E [Acidimicrobiales bacterium]
MRRALGPIVVLVVIWLLAWGSVTWANLLSGIAVAVGIVVVVPDVRRASHLPIVRPLPALRLVGSMLRDVVVSNVVLAGQVLSRRPQIATGVVRVPLAGCSDEVLTVIANLVAMTPGTMPIEVDQHPTVLYVHVLHLDHPDEVRRRIWHLRDLVVRTFGTAEAIADVDRVKAESLGRTPS